jgi:predicted nuclease of predicted toxin-antitoxin system
VQVEEIGLQGASDEAILARCVVDGRICITLDADFHRILSFTGAAQPSVIRIRMQHLRAQASADLIVRILHQVGSELLEGIAVSVNATNIRLRRLPLHSSSGLESEQT